MVTSQRITPALKKKLPQYQVKDMDEWHATLDSLKLAWGHVANGTNLPSVNGLDAKDTLSKVAQAKNSIALVESSLQIAEETLAHEEKQAKQKEADAKEEARRGKRKNKAQKKDGKRRKDKKASSEE